MTLTRTRYLKSIKPPAIGMLKPGGNNKKLGSVVKNKKWQGSKIYSLTLEERASCPTSCEQWNNCYGNNMPFAHRFDHTHPDFLAYLEADIIRVCVKHPEGVVIRLHVLGDFFSTPYVLFWGEMLRRHHGLKIFGYTHHRLGTPIGDTLQTLNETSADRSAIRFSDDPTTDFSAFTIKKGEPIGEGIVCPEQQGRVASCADCALCWSATKRILFLEH